MDFRKFPQISLNVSWPRPTEHRSSLATWAVGLGLVAGAAAVAYGVQRVRTVITGATTNHRPRHDHRSEQTQPGLSG